MDVSSAIDLAARTEAEKDALTLSLLPLVRQLKDALARVAVLEAPIEDLTRRPRRPTTHPPRRPWQPSPTAPCRRSCALAPRQPGTARALAENPDCIVGAHLAACPSCRAGFPAEAQTQQSVRVQRRDLDAGGGPDLVGVGLVTSLGVLHLTRPSRGRVVPATVVAGVRPVWVSDALGSQRGHAERWRMCLAHRLRDAQWAIDCGDAVFSGQLKLWLLRAMAIGRRRDGCNTATTWTAGPTASWRMRCRREEWGEKLRRRIGRCPEYLKVFVADRCVPPSNNVSERALRPSVVFRKATAKLARG